MNLKTMGTRKDVSLTRFTGKYIKGNWDFFFFSLFDKKGNNSKFIQTEGVISGKEKDRHLKGQMISKIGQFFIQLQKKHMVLQHGKK